jgi:hypothetical protein
MQRFALTGEVCSSDSDSYACGVRRAIFLQPQTKVSEFGRLMNCWIVISDSYALGVKVTLPLCVVKPLIKWPCIDAGTQGAMAARNASQDREAVFETGESLEQRPIITGHYSSSA